MRSSRALALAAVLVSSVSVPALADFDRIGSINVSYGQDKDSAFPDLGGPVERLQFIARSGDVVCTNVVAAFRTGRKASIFSGTLRQNSPRSIDLPGTSQDIRRINTNCHADRRGGATIDIYADIGRYRDTWRKSPNWSNTWSKMFNWTAGVGQSAEQVLDRNTSYAVTLGTVRFVGGRDSDGIANAQAGKSINSIGLKPLDADASCSRILATFSNGRRVDLAKQGTMRQGRTYNVDLPGNADRNLMRLTMTCHAENRQAVNIQVTGNK